MSWTPPELTEENRRALIDWCDLLEMGQWRQAIGHLGSGNQRCCLGVACEYAVTQGVLRRGEDDWSADIIYHDLNAEFEYTYVMPGVVAYMLFGENYHHYTEVATIERGGGRGYDPIIPSADLGRRDRRGEGYVTLSALNDNETPHWVIALLVRHYYLGWTLSESDWDYIQDPSGNYCLEPNGA